MSEQNVTIHLLGKSYPIQCPADKGHDLQRAALLLDERLQEVRNRNPQNSLEKTAITAALNLSYELLLAKQGSDIDSTQWRARMQGMQKQITDALTEQEEL